jgi:[ribosomal protein S18]-alanine N-acetyltransferase
LQQLAFAAKLQLNLEYSVRCNIRNYRPGDFKTLLAIDQSCFPAGIAYTQFELKTFILRRGSFTLIADAANGAIHNESIPGAEAPKDPSILGFIVAERSGAAGHIITIDVRAEARRHHIGSDLLQSAEEQFRLWNCNGVRLETAVDNISALSFYKRHGFNVVKTIPRYYSNGVDALLLEKDLLSPPSSR